MLRMLEEPDQDEENAPLTEKNDAADSHDDVLTELDFPWALINAARALMHLCQTKFRSSDRMLMSFEFQLLILSILCLLSLIFGLIFSNQCSNDWMLCIVLIVQGSCGLLIILIYIWVTVFRCRPTKRMDSLLADRQSIWYLMVFAHLMTIFCILWFFIGHIWFIPAIVGIDPSCSSVLHHFIRIVLPIHYLLGLWIGACHLWNSPKALSWIENRVHRRVGQLSSVEHLGIMPAAYADNEENTDEILNQNPQLNCV